MKSSQNRQLMLYGQWQFTVFDIGTSVTWSQWRARPGRWQLLPRLIRTALAVS
jgi:hypothetical protein